MSDLTYADVFRRTDAAAKADLRADLLQDYQHFKNWLIEAEDTPADVEAALTGFIWGNMVTEGEADG